LIQAGSLASFKLKVTEITDT